MKKVIIFGATSDIAKFVAIEFAKNGDELILTGRNIEKLISIKNDILSRYNTRIELFETNIIDFDKHQSYFQQATSILNGLDVVLFAYGSLPEQESIKNSPEKIINEFNINATSVFSLSTLFAEYFENKKSGTIAVISSVAGDRGRASNYIYGTAKGAVSIFYQGLRNRLSKSNVNVVTIKPGFVDTKMTSHLKKNFLFANPASVGEKIYDAISAGKDVVYVPSFWSLIMWVIKHIPESIFKKLNL